MNTLKTKLGIFSSEYKLICHRKVTADTIECCTLKGPYITDNGCLAFRKKTFFGELAKQIKNAVRRGHAHLEGYVCATLDDALDGSLGDGEKEAREEAYRRFKEIQRINKNGNGNYIEKRDLK